MEGKRFGVREAWIHIFTLPLMKGLILGLCFLRDKMGVKHFIGVFVVKVNGTTSV